MISGSLTCEQPPGTRNFTQDACRAALESHSVSILPVVAQKHTITKTNQLMSLRQYQECNTPDSEAGLSEPPCAGIAGIS